MSYKKLEETTGVGKTIVLRDKWRTNTFYRLKCTDQVSQSDGEQKYVVQRLELGPDGCCEGDPTRELIRIGYYTQRTDGRFCFGSQYAPILTPSELIALLREMFRKGWLRWSDDPENPIIWC